MFCCFNSIGIEFPDIIPLRAIPRGKITEIGNYSFPAFAVLVECTHVIGSTHHFVVVTMIEKHIRVDRDLTLQVSVIIFFQSGT